MLEFNSNILANDLPAWAPDTIVIICLVIIFAIPISYMIYSKVKHGHCGSCGCACGAARSSSKLHRVFKKDFKAKKEKAALEKANKNKSCCCCENKSVEAKPVDLETKVEDKTETKSE